jgi:hypothetical protein
MRTIRSSWPLLALWGMMFSSGIARPQATTLPPPRPAAYVLPPTNQLPEVPPIVDPILDDSPVAAPGFFTNVELFFLRPHLNSHLSDSFPVSPTQVDTVNMQISGPLGTTVSPRFEVGYRLPEQLGEFLLAYRFEMLERTNTPSESLSEKNRLNMNLIDLDWGNHHPFGLQIPGWDIRPNIGVRIGTIYFDTRQEFGGPLFNPAGVIEQRATSNFVGAGPETGLEGFREVLTPGLALYGKVSGAFLFGEMHQTFSETTIGPGGILSGSSGLSGQVLVPNLTVQAGISYTVPEWNYCRILFGYVWEEFWQIGRVNGLLNNNGDLLNRGLFLRAEINF